MRKTYLKNISTILFFVIIMVLIILRIFIVDRNNKNNAKYEKRIIAMSFVDSSAVQVNGYIMNGLMTEILNKLSNMDYLKIIHYTSVKNNIDSTKSIYELAEELGIDYILDGSGMKTNENIKLTLRLKGIVAIDSCTTITMHSEMKEDSIYEIQQNALISVVSILKKNITQKEKEAIYKIPTKNLIAYNIYLQGLNFYINNNDSENVENKDRAKKLFKQSTRLDPTFAEPYSYLAKLYLEEYSYAIY